MAGQSHREGRPSGNATDVERLLENGRWIVDDGMPGLAFSGIADGAPSAWGGDCAHVAMDNEEVCPWLMAVRRSALRYRTVIGHVYLFHWR